MSTEKIGPECFGGDEYGLSREESQRVYETARDAVRTTPSARIYTADEARALLTGITPGRWTTCLRADLCVVVDDGTEEGGDGDPVAEILITDERPSRNQMADALLLAAAPDLAASVEHHAARADALAADLQRVTMEMHAARHLAEESQRARVKQSLELAEARAEVVRLNARVADLESSLRDHAEVCSFCGRGGSWCCTDRYHRADGVLRSTEAPAGGST